MGPTKIALSIIILCFIIIIIILPLAMAQQPPGTFSVEESLDAHNKARAEVGVGPLKWNDTLVAYATTYASQRVGDCELVHSDGPYGENMAEASWDASAAEFIKMWVDEKPFYDYHSNTCKGGDCLHYTQIVWNTTARVGCAKAQCKSNGWFFFTCNYDPLATT